MPNQDPERMKNCCFTGHREIPTAQREELFKELCSIIRSLYAQGVTRFSAGGALGFDTLAAQAVLTVRDELTVTLHLILPCREQDRYWSEKDKAVYATILEQADTVFYTAERYSRGCMLKRNRALVDVSSYCVYYLKKPTGGTKYTVDYAGSQGLSMIPVGQ